MTLLHARLSFTKAVFAFVIGFVFVAVVSIIVNPDLIPRASSEGDEMRFSGGVDPTNKRKLTGFAKNVFVGRVVEQIGTQGLPTSRPGSSLPMTQFKVEVLENIKGKLEGTVIVNQRGGEADGQLQLEDDDPLLLPGQQYLFLTRPADMRTPSGDPIGQGWHEIFSPNAGDIRVKDENHRAALVKDFKQAHKEEIPPEQMGN